MQYEAKNYQKLKGINALSDDLLEVHFGLYQGYVANTNKLLEILDEMLRSDKCGQAEYAELQRRFGWEWNGMRLHEYYFENISKDSKPLKQDSVLMKKMVEEFGSWENWQADFRAVASMRGIGWAILYYDEHSGKLFNTWIAEHDGGHLAGAKPLLLVDLFEHAYLHDYGTKRAEYLNAVMPMIDWETVEARF
jgi:Fe-Mn family superoxide dismutase